MNDRLQFLFNKYIVDEMTAEEKSELAKLIGSANDQKISDLLKQEWENNEEEISVLSSDEADSILKLIIGEKSAKIIPIHFYKKTWFRVAAAVLFIVGVFSIYKMVGTNKTTEKVLVHVEKVNQDIPPGSYKAILTLSDGSTINLDSARNGILSQQLNAKIIKLADGKLSYQSVNAEEVKIQYNTITTPRGGQYQLTLSDGSQVWLNAASSITFPAAFTGDKRQVEITGEAYFEVAHNVNMPFYASVNGMEVKVLGTHFNVNAYEGEEEIKTTLLEGSVKVSQGSKSVTIKPDQQAQVNNLTDVIRIHDNVNLEEVIAWKNGQFYFDHADIKTIMHQISRWYNVEVIYEGKISKVFEGSISRNLNASSVLKILEATGGVHFKIENKKIIVLP